MLRDSARAILTRRPWRLELPLAILACLYIAGWAISPWYTRTAASDLDTFFWPAAQVGAHGHPFNAYSAHINDAYPIATGPVGLLLLMPFAAVANAVGWASDLRAHAALADVLSAVFAVLLAAEATRLLTAARGALGWRLATPCVILLSPVLWISVSEYGHYEQVIELYLVLLAVRSTLANRPVRAGAPLGMAVLTRTVALSSAIPLALLPFATRRFRTTAVLLATAGVTVAIIAAPFVLVDGGKVVYSLVTYRGDLPIGGGSLWVATLRSGAADVVKHGDSALSMLLAAVLCAAALRRRPALATSPAGLCGLLCIAATCFPMLAKAAYPYYLFEPYVFGAMWWLARTGSPVNWRAAVPILLTIDAFLTNWATSLPLTGKGLAEGVASSLLLAVVIALVMADLLARPQRSARPAFQEVTA